VKRRNSEVNGTPFFKVSCADAFLTTWLLGVAVPVSLMLLVLTGCTGSAGSAGFVEDRAVIRFPLRNRQAAPFFFPPGTRWLDARLRRHAPQPRVQSQEPVVLSKPRTRYHVRVQRHGIRPKRLSS